MASLGGQQQCSPGRNKQGILLGAPWAEQTDGLLCSVLDQPHDHAYVLSQLIQMQSAGLHVLLF